jgi:chromosome segregation ATPase
LLDYAIAFFLGVTLTGLAGLAMVPAVWVRARRLIRREMETSLPLSMTQVRAAQDHVRAEAAMTHRRLEQKLERERTLRHDLMAEHGRQSERLRRIEALIGIDANRLGSIEEGAASAQRDVLMAQQDVAGLKAELAASRVTIALRDDKAAEHEREINAARIGNDSLRVELVALRTKLNAAEDGSSLQQRELQQLLQATTDKDDRLAVQAVELMRRETAIAALETRVASLSREFEAMAQRGQAAALEKSDLEIRLATLSADIRRRDAALAERDVRLAIAAGREAEFVTELARLRRASEPSAADDEINALRFERARLQTELASLREDAHESWLRIEADNHMLRREMAQIAAEIARDVASRAAIGVAPAERVAANDQIDAGMIGAAGTDAR